MTMTPAARLRQAAQLARETAEAARDVTGAGDWHVATAWAGAEESGWMCYAVQSSGGRVSTESSEEEATHLALWSPPVALAVAAWLEDEAERAEVRVREWTDPAALAVADALLQTHESPAASRS